MTENLVTRVHISQAPTMRMISNHLVKLSYPTTPSQRNQSPEPKLKVPSCHTCLGLSRLEGLTGQHHFYTEPGV